VEWWGKCGGVETGGREGIVRAPKRAPSPSHASERRESGFVSCCLDLAEAAMSIGLADIEFVMLSRFARALLGLIMTNPRY
jgi:hypothetical protein